MDRRRLLVLALARWSAAGCGEGAVTAPAGPAAATVLVTRDFGQTLMKQARVAPDQSALNALRRSADVGTSLRRPVREVDRRVEGDKGRRLDWLYFVNGIDPGVGSADVTLHQGDREWWDYRYWKDFIGVPAVIGAWPEPFVHGLEGHRPTVAVTGPACAGSLRSALTADGARVGTGGSYDVRVTTFADAASVLRSWQRWALTVRVSGDAVQVYRGAAGWSAVPGARAVVVARVPHGIPGRSFELLVAGADQAAACAAAGTIAKNPVAIAGRYTAAMDGSGHVLASGGRE